jgi:hypothetical protein
MKKRYANSNEVFWGKEPESKDIDPLSPNFTAFLSEALAWYNYSSSSEKKKGWFIEWVKKNKPTANIEAIEQVYEGAFTTAGAVARIVSRGLTTSSYLNGKIISWIGKFQEEGSKILRAKEQKKIAKKKIGEVDPRLSYLIGTLDSEIDNFINSGYKSDFDMNNWLRLNTPSPAHHAAIKDRFFPLLDELVNEQNDEQITEAYSHLTEKQYNRFVELVLDIVSTKVIRKARVTHKRKDKTPSKIVSKVKYAESDPATGMKSVSPTSIPGSKTIWVWNKKYRTLGVYNVSDGGELSVKGTTILNFDPITSLQKKIRKPNDVLPKIMAGNKAAMNRIFTEINCKPAKMNGRINSDTLLLKVS